MEWLAQNWMWLALAGGAMWLMHRGGGACGMHGHSHRPRLDPGPADGSTPDAASEKTSALHGATTETAPVPRGHRGCCG